MRLTFELSDYSWIVRKLTGPATRSTFLIGFVKRRQIGFFKMASSPKFDERWLKGQNAQNLQREDKTYTLTLITSSPYFFEKFQRQFQESLANFVLARRLENLGFYFRISNSLTIRTSYAGIGTGTGTQNFAGLSRPVSCTSLILRSFSEFQRF